MGWGGYVFIINLIPLHVLVLILMGRFSHRIYVAYNSFFIIGLLCSMQIPFVGFLPVSTSEHMASAGVFGLLQIVGFFKYMSSVLTKAEFKKFLMVAGTLMVAAVLVVMLAISYSGSVAGWSGRFYSLWDTGYAKIHTPIIASVSEHQPTTWFSFFFDLHILACVFPVGLWYCIKNVNDERVFIILYAVSAVYFAGVMVRLMLTLTPCVCVLSAIAFSTLFERYLKEDDVGGSSNNETNVSNGNDDLHQIQEAPKSQAQRKVNRENKNGRPYDKVGKIRKLKLEQTQSDEGLGGNIRSIVILAVLMMLMMFAVHCTWVTSNAYSSPSIVLASYRQDGGRNILDDFREAHYWLWQNTAEDATVMSWWDYGYQIAGMANRTTLVDNNTWNNSHIALVGKAMSSNESRAYEIM